MKIILSTNEDVYLDMLLNDIDPELKANFVRGVNTSPLINATTDDDGNGIYDISEEYVLGVIDILIKHTPVVVPLCKGLYAAVKTMTTEVINFVQDLTEKLTKRRNDMAKAQYEYEIAKEKLRQAKVGGINPSHYRVNLKKSDK